jgi:hypothetical protein
MSYIFNFEGEFQKRFERLLVWKPFFLLVDALLFIFDEDIRQSTAQDVFRTPFGKIYVSRIFWIPV